MNSGILYILESLEKETGLPREKLVEALELAIASVIRKKFGENEEISVSFKSKIGKLELCVSGKQISLASLGRTAVQNIKQAIVREIRKAEWEKVYHNYSSQVGTVVAGEVETMEGSNLVINLGEEKGILPQKECLPQDNYRIGDRLKAYLFKINRESSISPIILSRTHPNFLLKLLQLEIPELQEGVIEIKGAVREPGSRAKIAVVSGMEKVDSIGACVGLKGSRVSAVTNELKGEKIDIIPWDKDKKVFIGRALSPAEVSQVEIFPEDNQARVTVEDDQLSLAIGKRGQNVRLAARLTGWKLDIRSKTQDEEEKGYKPKEVEKHLRQISGVGDTIAKQLGKHGFISLKDVAKAKVSDLTALPRLSKKKAEEMIEEAKKLTKRL